MIFQLQPMIYHFQVWFLQGNISYSVYIYIYRYLNSIHHSSSFIYSVGWRVFFIEASFRKVLYPIGSMYGIFTYIYHNKNQPNVGKYNYNIHGSYGIWTSWGCFFDQENSHREIPCPSQNPVAAAGFEAKVQNKISRPPRFTLSHRCFPQHLRFASFQWSQGWKQLQNHLRVTKEEKRP